MRKYLRLVSCYSMISNVWDLLAFGGYFHVWPNSKKDPQRFGAGGFHSTKLGFEIRAVVG
jgi:hypothetical protein